MDVYGILYVKSEEYMSLVGNVRLEGETDDGQKMLVNSNCNRIAAISSLTSKAFSSKHDIP